MSSTQYHNW